METTTTTDMNHKKMCKKRSKISLKKSFIQQNNNNCESPSSTTNSTTTEKQEFLINLCGSSSRKSSKTTEILLDSQKLSPAYRIQVTLHKPLSWRCSSSNSTTTTTRSSSKFENSSDSGEKPPKKSIKIHGTDTDTNSRTLPEKSCRRSEQIVAINPAVQDLSSPSSTSSCCYSFRAEKMKNKYSKYPYNSSNGNGKMQISPAAELGRNHDGLLGNLSDSRYINTTNTTTGSTTYTSTDFNRGRVARKKRHFCSQSKKRSLSSSILWRGPEVDDGQLTCCSPLQAHNKENTWYCRIGMGANASQPENNLKARSQSSSALFTVHQTTQNQNNEVKGQRSSDLSASIPTDLWNSPTIINTKSAFRQNKRNHRQQKTLDALLGRNANRKNKGLGKKGRDAYYAVSCPDVAAQTEAEDFFGSEKLNLESIDNYELFSPQQDYHEQQLKNYELSQETMKYSLQLPAFQIITQGEIFESLIRRDASGLGFSITGGVDSNEIYPGLIRVKKVFPMGPASRAGRISSWDIILKANGIPLTGLTTHQALDVLRATPMDTVLTVCRPPATLMGYTESQITFPSQPLHFSSNYIYPPDGDSCGDQDDLDGSIQYLSSSFRSPGGQLGQLGRQSPKSKSLSSLKIPSNQPQLFFGEFEITMEKLAGSLGFTLQQEDSSVLGHYVRALVKDPALSDGRIMPGDRLLSVNGQDLSEFSHSQAIAFIRQSPIEVHLRFYRDVSPTPISPLSPTESHKAINYPKNKHFRQEALDMIQEISARKRMSGNSDPSQKNSILGRSKLSSPADSSMPNTLPRRRIGQNVNMTPSPQVLSAALDRFKVQSAGSSSSNNSPAGSSVGSSIVVLENHPKNHQKNHGKVNIMTENRSSGSGESSGGTPAGTIMQKKTTTKYTQNQNFSNFSNSNNSNGKIRSKVSPSISTSSSSSTTILADDLVDENTNSPLRVPSFRQFSMHLDRLSSLEESLPDLTHQRKSIVSESGLDFGQDLSSSNERNNFKHGQPTYQSAILPSSTPKNKAQSRHGPTSLDQNTQKMTSEQKSDQMGKESTSGKKSGGLMKWKGIVFSQDDDENGPQNETIYDPNEHIEGDDDETDLDSTISRINNNSSSYRNKKVVGKVAGSLSSSSTSTSSGSRGGQVRSRLSQRHSPDGREFQECEPDGPVGAGQTETVIERNAAGEQIFTIQLSRRWCSRLGFSLQGSSGRTHISAIYPDSVASKDGRLLVGDEIIMVNGETIRDKDTTEVIDQMRKTRGMISITILRKD